MNSGVIRIISDVHLGDPASMVVRCAQLAPLLDGVAALVLNGDTLETRPTLAAAHVAPHWADLTAFRGRHANRVILLTGNHDPAVSPHHWLDLAAGSVFVTHGEVLFDDVSPWSPEAPFLRTRMRQLRAGRAPEQRDDFAALCDLCKRASAESPPHLRRPLPPALRLAADALTKIWPWWRLPRMLWAWTVLPGRAAALARRHRPRARFVLVGHTHRPGLWHRPGVTVINTGSFIVGLGGAVVDLTDQTLVVRRLARSGEDFRAGREVARFDLPRPAARQTALAEATANVTPSLT